MIRLNGRCSVRPVLRFTVLSILLVLSISAGLAWSGSIEASSQRVLSVTAFPREIPAKGGESRITVRIPADAVADETRVKLSAEIGAFLAGSGPSEITAPLNDVGNNTLGASVRLVADGRTGASVVTAQVGSLVDTVTVRFVGETATVRVDQPAEQARLRAADQHLIKVVASDETGIGAPSANVTFEFLSAPLGALLRSETESSLTRLTVRTSLGGEARAWLSSEPGDVRIRATSGSASVTLALQLYGEPKTLRLVPISGTAIEVGTISATGTLQALLLDERGQGVPRERIRFSPEGGLVVASDGDGESLVTDGSGSARAHLDARSARLGLRSLTAVWTKGEQILSDALEVTVTGPPTAMYLRARLSLADVEEVLIEEFSASTRYRLEAEVVDELGQPVAGSYKVRWRPLLISEAAAQAYPEVSVTQNGVAKAIFDLEHVDGLPQPQATLAQAWLIAKAQVNSNGVIADLLGDGVPLRASWNDLIWRGQETTVSVAVAEVRHVVSAAWKRTTSGGWQAWFTADVPGAVDFELKPGDNFLLVLSSGALLQNVARR